MFRFKKNCRLHNFKLINSLKESGEIFYSSDVLKGKCFVTEKNNIFTNLSEIQILITVPKKIFKRAVDRNLIKRRIREIFRLNKSQLTYFPNKIICFEVIYISHIILKFVLVYLYKNKTLKKHILYRLTYTNNYTNH